MSCKCNTVDGRRWMSVVNGRFEGEIEIQQEDGNGNFRGHHHGHREEIMGTCTPAGITFQLPASGGRFFYQGRFVLGTCDMVSGTRRRIGPLVEGEAALVTDDWVGTKPTTFTITQELFTGSSEQRPTGESAEQSSAGESAGKSSAGE